MTLYIEVLIRIILYAVYLTISHFCAGIIKWEGDFHYCVRYTPEYLKRSL